MINENRSKTGERIKNLRIEAGYKSIESFAEKLGYSRQTVAKWEKGEVMPTLDTLCDIVTILDCDIGYLLCLYETRYFEHAEICEETRLSEAAVNKLEKLSKSNKIQEERWAESHKAEIFPVHNIRVVSTEAMFASYLLENGKDIFRTIEDLAKYEVSIKSIKNLPYYRQIKDAFDESQKIDRFSLLGYSEENDLYSLEVRSREQYFYSTLKDKLQSFLSEANMERTTEGNSVEEMKKIHDEVESNIEYEIDEILENSVYGEPDLYNLLITEKEHELFKYRLSHIFMNIVMDYVKEGAEDGREN